MTTISAASRRSALIERFTAPGQPFEIGERTVNGVPMRVYTTGPQTLREIALAMAAFGDRPFLVYSGERWTYAEQARIIAGLARCMAEEYGLRKGDRVAVTMRNYPEWVPVFWATQVLGLVLVPLNAWWTAAELRYGLADAGARLVVADAERTALLAPDLGELGQLPLIEVRGSAHPEDYASLAGIAMGGAPIPPVLIGRVDASFDRPVAPANGYGLTETTSAVVSNSGSDYLSRPDSVGRCQPGADIRVVDQASGEDVTDGEVGELWFRGPNIVRGYWNNADATAAAFTDGWFHTGDLGRVADGWVYVVDRMKDVVIRGGENIYCAEVEAALFEHPAIEDAAIVGIPHETLGEEAVAVVVRHDGASLVAGDVQRHVAERLASFKVPAHVVFWSGPLPRTQSGKVLKRELRSAVAAKVRARRDG